MAAEGSGPVDRLEAYLVDAGRCGRGWATDGTALVRPVVVHTESWRGFVRDVVVPPPVQEGLVEALDRMAAAGDRVDRQLLAEMAPVGEDHTRELVMCWFAVMCWGAGPRWRFRLRQWTRAVPSEGFVASLEASRRCLEAGDLARAYRHSLLPGVGEAYLTKWLWALGLAGPDADVQPYILDARVWQVLGVLGWRPAGRNRAERWVDYCCTLDLWAEELNQRRAGWRVDGEGIEHLMFDREAGHFGAWLGRQPPPSDSSPSELGTHR